MTIKTSRTSCALAVDTA